MKIHITLPHTMPMLSVGWMHHDPTMAVWELLQVPRMETTQKLSKASSASDKCKSMMPKYISKMDSCHCEILGVCGRFWTRITQWSNHTVDWTDVVAFRCAWQCLEVLATNQRGHRRSVEN